MAELSGAAGDGDMETLKTAGDPWAELVAWLSIIVDFLHLPGNGRLLRSIMALSAENEHVAKRLNERLGLWRVLGERLGADPVRRGDGHRRRRARRGRGHLGRLPARRRRLPGPRSSRRKVASSDCSYTLDCDEPLRAHLCQPRQPLVRPEIASHVDGQGLLGRVRILVAGQVNESLTLAGAEFAAVAPVAVF